MSDFKINYLKKYYDDNVIKFLSQHVDINEQNINIGNSISDEVINLKGFISTVSINNLLEINTFFRSINFSLQNNGFFIGCFENYKSRYKRLYGKFNFLRKFLIFIDFL